MIVVVGVPSGGTSATTGTLTKNGYYNRGADNPFFETSHNLPAYPTMFQFPTRQLMPADLFTIAKYFYNYKKEAIENGYDRAVIKLAWGALFQPEIFGENRLGVMVESLLVHRDPKTNAQSMHDRKMGKEQHEWLAKIGQERVLKLHEKFGWPLFTFGQEALHADLEAAVGHELPTPYFDPDRVRH
jgi:hypothetical protein